MAAIAQPGAITVSCPDPESLAEFYARATGWQKIFSSDTAAYLAGQNGMRLGFVKIDGYAPPAWPEAAHRLHIDFSVEDLDKAEAELVNLGAVKPEYQPGEGKWTVLLDPAGYPFCITTMAG
ncbi:VOC family protein [Streptomyces goshikiensis]|uniref:VOC family protein n=2 Tax=Streptomyces goshikiensis TaxID=1942 RepID=UPI0036664F6E